MAKIDQRAWKRIESFLENRSFAGFTSKHLFIMTFIKKGWGQDIAALSNMAEAIQLRQKVGLIDEDIARNLLTETLARAQHRTVSPYKHAISNKTKLGHHGYYLEHLNLILGIAIAAGAEIEQELNLKISKHLSDLSLAEKNAHAPLMPRVKMRWSADQAAILKSLWICDQNHSTNFYGGPSEKWLNYMKTKMTHPETGLFETEAMRVKRYSKQPRGCSLSYMIHYMASFAETEASEQWSLYKRHMKKKCFGLYGFREYLPTYEGKWTPDSGPIIGGIGVAATGLGLKTATTLKDQETREKLKKSLDKILSVCWLLQPIPGVKKVTALGTDVLASSVYANGLNKD